MENTLAPMVQQDKDMLLVTGGQQLMASAPAILQQNKTSAERASYAAEQLIERIKRNNNVLNPELDLAAQSMIVKINATLVKMDDLRKPVTQIFDAIKKMFTEQEKKLDPKAVGTPSYNLQLHRNAYAKFLMVEQQRKQKEAADLAEIENKKASLRAAITNKIIGVLSNYRYNKMAQRKASFDSTTLENFNEKEKAITNLMCVFDSTQIKAIMVFDFPATNLDDNTRDAIKKEVLDGYSYEAFRLDYNKVLSEQRREFIDMLPSKKTELESFASASATEALEMENLRMMREDDEREKMQKQKLQEEKDAAAVVHIQAQAATALNLFEQSTAAIPEVAAPEARTGYEIIVLHPAALVEIFTAWYQREGVKLPIDDSRKKTVNQMIKFLENAAKSDEFFIKSTFLKYEATAKAVNRKAA